MALNTIVFDLDGTLVDTVPDVRVALNSMLAAYGLQGIEREKIHSLIGDGAKVMVEKAFLENNVKLQVQEIEAATNIYLNYYRAKPVVETKIYPGVVQTLKYFRSANMKLAICTNKPSVMATIVLQRLNLTSFFDAIIAGDEVPKPKPHADHLQRVLDNIESDSANAVMVGDSVIDMQCADNAGIPFVGVSYGYHLGKLAAENVIDHFFDLPRALRV